MKFLLMWDDIPLSILKRKPAADRDGSQTNTDKGRTVKSYYDT
jgi:hypothetical protein